MRILCLSGQIDCVACYLADVLFELTLLLCMPIDQIILYLHLQSIFIILMLFSRSISFGVKHLLQLPS